VFRLVWRSLCLIVVYKLFSSSLKGRGRAITIKKNSGKRKVNVSSVLAEWIAVTDLFRTSVGNGILGIYSLSSHLCGQWYKQLKLSDGFSCNSKLYSNMFYNFE
jgi:hypothetical protein